VTTRITATEAAQADALREAPQLDEYQTRVAHALTKVFDDHETEEQEVDLETARLVVLSDHHKGERDGADDFRGCEPAYAAALAYYLEEGFRLFALGDVEELWESTAKKVLASYPDILELEGQFYAQGRYERFWGNHDLQWSQPSQVAKHLTRFYPGLQMREALRLRVVRGGEPLGLVFLVHGHQGTLDSDRWAWLSRPVVRYVWAPLQRKLNMRSTQPSRNFQLRQRHDVAMYSWARSHAAKPVLIAGHTHRPVFWTSQAPIKDSPKDLSAQLDALRASGHASEEELGKLRSRLEYVRAELREQGPAPIVIDPPCYFNTGCCSFGDGDVTGIEIVNGDIRLVRWPNDDDEPLPKLLVEADLAEVLSLVSAAS
jgi:UDP-2,3-diacylglucosamine pyrophosphatase LpxH